MIMNDINASSLPVNKAYSKEVTKSIEIQDDTENENVEGNSMIFNLQYPKE